MEDAKRHPLDILALKKGDVITVEQLEVMTKKARDTVAFQFAVMGIREWIMRERMLIGEPVTVKGDHGALRILTDEESTIYNHTEFKSSMSGMIRSHERLLTVDTSQFSDELKKQHERHALIQSRILQGALMGKKNQLPQGDKQACLTGK